MFFPGTKFQYDPEFKGPCRNRSCTDVLCLLLFALFIIAWIIVGILGGFHVYNILNVLLHFHLMKYLLRIMFDM